MCAPVFFMLTFPYNWEIVSSSEFFPTCKHQVHQLGFCHVSLYNWEMTSTSVFLLPLPTSALLIFKCKTARINWVCRLPRFSPFYSTGNRCHCSSRPVVLEIEPSVNGASPVLQGLHYVYLDPETNSAIKCCEDGQKIVPSPHFACLPVDITADDRFYSRFGQWCIEFVRATIVPSTPDSNLGFENQVRSNFNLTKAIGH